MRPKLGWQWWMCGWIAVSACSVTGQSPSWWRTFKVIDGMAEAACVSVTTTVRGDVVVRHRRTNAVTRLDGYEARILEVPARAGPKVWEWHTGQLWSPSTGGVYLWSGGTWQWIPVYVPPTESNQPAEVVTPTTPIRPVRTGKLLILLPDQLLALHVGRSGESRVEVLQTARRLGVGPLVDLVVTRDGSVWVSGQRGLSRAELPARSVQPDTTWRSWAVPEGWEIEALHGLAEDELGHLVMTAVLRDGTQRAVEFDGTRWWPGPMLPARTFRAFHGPGHILWAVTDTSLWRFDARRQRWLEDDTCPAREFYDATVAPDGSFWVATLDGLLKYSPPLWQPADPQLGSEPVLCVTEGGDGTLWLLRPDRLDQWEGQLTDSVPLPIGVELAEVRHCRLWLVGRGTLWLEEEGRTWVRTEQSADWQPIVTPGGRQPKALGLREDGTAVVRGLPTHDGSENRAELWLWREGQWFRRDSPGSSSAVNPDGWTLYLQARNGDEWFAGAAGLVRIRMGREQTFLLGGAEGHESVHFLAEGPDGRIYAAGHGQVWCWDDREWTLVWSGTDPLAALACTRDGGLWIAGPEGLFRRTEAGWIGQGVEEGLPAGSLHQLWEDRRGRLWAATAKGLYSWNPHADRDPPRSELSLPPELKLPEGAVLTVGFYGRDRWKYTPAARLLYSYRLNAGDWTPVQELTVGLWNDLPPGRHVLQVRAIDRCGNVEQSPARREIVVLLPWYRDPRVALATVVGGVGVVFFAALAWNRHRRLRRSYAEVERQVAERTRQLENAYQELLQSQKMRALGTLAAGVAHDFNNILSIIKGSVQVIEDHMDDPAKVRRRLERIKAMVEQGTRVVQAMLGFSRASGERLEPVNLNHVVQDTLALLGDRWTPACRVVFEPAADLPEVPAIRDLVQQILLNLLLNAAEAGDQSGVIVVRTARRNRLPDGMALRPTEAAEYGEVAVQDFGCGIRPEDLPRIFEPFFTTKAFSSRKGTGLGLTMVYEMSKRLGAGLAVETQPGRGSTFRLMLPVLPAERPLPVETPSEAPPPGPADRPVPPGPVGAPLGETSGPAPQGSVASKIEPWRT